MWDSSVWLSFEFNVNAAVWTTFMLRIRRTSGYVVLRLVLLCIHSCDWNLCAVLVISRYLRASWQISDQFVVCLWESSACQIGRFVVLGSCAGTICLILDLLDVPKKINQLTRDRATIVNWLWMVVRVWSTCKFMTVLAMKNFKRNCSFSQFSVCVCVKGLIKEKQKLCSIVLNFWN